MQFRPVAIRFLVCVSVSAVVACMQGTAHGQEYPVGPGYPVGGCATGNCGAGGCASCGQPCQHHHCPPPYHHCQEGPPRICIKCGCPRPVCDPHDLPHFGYFQPCWRMWPFPPDWSHCPYPTPASLIAPPPPGFVPPQQPATTTIPGTTLPTPRRLEDSPGM
jgi:hypothetical protein